MDGEIKTVGDEIERVGDDIAAVVVQLKRYGMIDVEKRTQKEENEINGLGDEEEQLRDEKNKLLDEKNKLLDERLLLLRARHSPNALEGVIAECGAIDEASTLFQERCTSWG